MGQGRLCQMCHTHDRKHGGLHCAHCIAHTHALRDGARVNRADYASYDQGRRDAFPFPLNCSRWALYLKCGPSVAGHVGDVDFSRAVHAGVVNFTTGQGTKVVDSYRHGPMVAQTSGSVIQMVVECFDAKPVQRVTLSTEDLFDDKSM